MQIDPSQFSFRDGLLVGWIVAQLLGERARRFQGVRLGKLERLMAKAIGVDPDDDDTGKHERKK